MHEREQPFAEWLGRTETVTDFIAPAPALMAAATLDDTESRFVAGVDLPPLWHWFYFLPKAPQSRIGPDGHPARGGFMPPIPLPRRMFAGGRLTFHRPLVIGRSAEREGVITSIAEKSGKSGTLAFVTVAYTFSQDGDVCITEEQDIVYRDESAEVVPAPPVVEPPVPPAGSWHRTIQPDPVLLFRFSALTFNGHRIHYDRTYATEVERYPGLVVHGPLTAVLLMDLIRCNSDRAVNTFSFRGLAPLFDLAPFRLTGLAADDTVTLQALGPDGKKAMTAEASLR
ncbi:MAG: acyl-CoA dehydrogenase [Rhodospirillales bacterium]|nr:MAG: acyl-CoA dehydrogenase [Rhodospirillales bacterium]